MAINNPEQQNRFNPNEHLMQLKSKEGPKDYLPVQFRLVWFREQCPQGTIDTEEICVNLDQEVEEEAYVWNAEKRKSERVIKRAKGYARFKAIVTDGKGGRATGTKSENAASFPDYIEKAETGAIGRALAGLGYGTAFAPEFNEAHRIVDSPIEHQQGNSEGGQDNASHHTNNQTSTPVAQSGEAGDALLSEQQLNSIRKLLEHLDKTEMPGLASMGYMEAKKLIQQLTAEYREQKNKPAPQNATNLSDIPTVQKLRERAKSLNLEWGTVIAEAFERPIQQGKITKQALIDKGDELSPDSCQRIASYLQAKQAA